MTEDETTQENQQAETPLSLDSLLIKLDPHGDPLVFGVLSNGQITEEIDLTTKIMILTIALNKQTLVYHSVVGQAKAEEAARAPKIHLPRA